MYGRKYFGNERTTFVIDTDGVVATVLRQSTGRARRSGSGGACADCLFQTRALPAGSGGL
jgi:hypothetical protein